MFKDLRRNKRGFTLIELIVVIAILAILAAIAIPTFAGITDEANKSVEIANAKTIATAINAHNALNTNSKISDPANWTTISANLKPTGLPTDTTALNKILARITITNGVATVDTTSASATAAPTT